MSIYYFCALYVRQTLYKALGQKGASVTDPALKEANSLVREDFRRLLEEKMIQAEPPQDGKNEQTISRREGTGTFGAKKAGTKATKKKIITYSKKQ